MNKKKVAALVLSSAMAASTVAGLCACSGGKDKFTLDGTVYNAVTANTFQASRADTRADAYVAKKANGTEIGKFKTIAAAINAAVNADVTDEIFEGKDKEPVSGSYVTKIGSEVKLFQNKNGYTPENDDQYWYYEDGNKLGGYNCWEPPISNLLQNTNHVVTQVTGKGRRTVQSWNSYSLRDPNGEEFAKNELTTEAWTLSSTMDAAVMQFVTETCSITGLDYTYDLSDVKITPPMGDAKTYAFIGCYTWQPYYVIALGLACDTSTGNWYPFHGTSRDDSFSQTEYNIGDDCVMTSTWHEDGGYFTPDSDTLTMQARTKFLKDSVGDDGKDIMYQVNDYKFECEGAGAYLLRVDDSFIGNYYAGKTLGVDNVYIAICGLDVVTPIKDGVKVANTDYFTGSKFENLRVTQASSYIATKEEIPDELMGVNVPDEEDRGKSFNLLMAADPSLKDEDFGNYTIFNSNAFVDYNKDNGQDVFSFRYDGSPVADNLYSAEVWNYQKQIEALSEMTIETAFDFDEEMAEIAGWYEKTDKTLPKHIGNVLDYTEYLNAKEKVVQAAKLSPEGEQAVAEFKKLSTIVPLYDYKGWTKPAAEASMAGYLYTELETFRKFKEIYDTIKDESEKNSNIFRHISKAQYTEWNSLNTAITALENDANFTARKFNLPELAANGAATEVKTRTGMNMVEDVIRLSYAIGAGKATSSDDKNSKKATHMNSDNHWTSSWHILYIILNLKEEEFNIFEDGYLGNLIATVTDENTEKLIEDVTYLYNVLKLSKYITDNCSIAIDEEIARVANKYMVEKTDFVEGGLAWNFNGSTFTGRNTKFMTYFGLKEREDWMFYIDVVTELLESKGATLTTSKKGGHLGITAEVQAAPSDLSEDAQKVVGLIKAVSPLTDKYVAYGWEAPEGVTDIKGYYYSEIQAVRAAKVELDKLNEADKAAVLANVNEAGWNAWLAEEKVIDAIIANAKWGETAFKVHNMKNTATKPDTTEIDWENPKWEQDDNPLLQPTYIVGQKVPVEMTSKQNGEYAFTQLLISVSNISATGKGCDWYDTSNFNYAIRVALCKDYLESIGVTLTPYLTKTLKDTLFNDWYEQIYTPITGLVDVVEYIRANSVENVSGLPTEMVKILNENYTTEFNKGHVFDVIWNGKANTGDTGGSLKEHGNWEWKITLLIRVHATMNGYPYAANKDLWSKYQEELDSFLTSNEFTIAADGWGVTVASLTETEPDGFVENKAGTLLPDKTAKWTINNGIDASSAEHMAVSAKTDSYQFTASKSGDWASVSVALTGKSFNVAKNAIYYDLKVSNGGKCDIVLYVKNGDGQVYGYLGEQFDTPVKTNITGEVKGHVSLQKLHDWYVQNKQLPSAETLEFVYVRVYVYDGTTVNVKSLYVDELPADELYGNAGTSYNPTDVAQLVEYQGNATVTVENGVTTVQANETVSVEGGDWAYSHNYELTNVMIGMDSVIYLDVEVTGKADILLYDNVKYTNFSRVIKGVASGAELATGKYALKLADLIKWHVDNNKDADSYRVLTTLSLTKLSFYVNSGATVKVNDFRIVNAAEVTPEA
ncbi:MAG: hypothetical protein HFE26_03080 [Clostridia bacterium]|nr:hypothetical protein [Clostridia bacterium]